MIKFVYIFIFCMLLSLFLSGQSHFIRDANEIEWHPDRELSWYDFKAYPDFGSHFSALSSTYLEETHGCNEAGDFYFEVKAFFVQDLSWSFDKTSVSLLKHEQLHFDITEYFARLLRKEFSTLKKPCDLSAVQLKNIVDSIFIDMESAHEFYDRHTIHGLRKDNQMLWDDMISKKLKSLDEYRSNDPRIFYNIY